MIATLFRWIFRTYVLKMVLRILPRMIPVLGRIFRR